MRLLRHRLIVTQAKALELRPGDRLVVECSERVSAEDGADIASWLAEFFDIEPERIMVIYNATLKVLREGDPPPPPVVLAPGRP